MPCCRINVASVNGNTKFVVAHRRRLDGLRDNGEVVEALLDEEADDPVAVEEEIAPGCVLVPDDGEESLELWRGLEGEDGGRKLFGHFGKMGSEGCGCGGKEEGRSGNWTMGRII